MQIRLIAVLPLLLALTGCSLLGLGENDEQLQQGVGSIKADTPFSEQGLATALGNKYRLRSGMGMRNDELFNFYQALKIDTKPEQLAQIIYGKSDSGILRIEVLESGISTGEASIGTYFSQLYAQAYGSCRLNQDSNTRFLICQSKTNKHIRYEFSGEWNGPIELIPDNAVLKNWKVSKIIWDRQARY